MSKEELGKSEGTTPLQEQGRERDKIFKGLEKMNTLDLLDGITDLGHSRATGAEHADPVVSARWVDLAVAAGDIAAVLREIDERGKEWDDAELSARKAKELVDKRVEQLRERARKLEEEAERLESERKRTGFEV